MFMLLVSPLLVIAPFTIRGYSTFLIHSQKNSVTGSRSDLRQSVLYKRSFVGRFDLSLVYHRFVYWRQKLTRSAAPGKPVQVELKQIAKTLSFVHCGIVLITSNRWVLSTAGTYFRFLKVKAISVN